MDEMGNAWMGAITDVMHDVHTGCLDDASMGAMIDMTHHVWTCCMDDAWMGVMKDVTYIVQRDGDFTGILLRNLPCFSPDNYRGILMGLQQTVMR